MKTIATGSPAGSLEVPFVAVSEVQELPAAVVVVVAAVLPLAERAGVLAVLQGEVVVLVSRATPAPPLVPGAPHLLVPALPGLLSRDGGLGGGRERDREVPVTADGHDGPAHPAHPDTPLEPHEAVLPPSRPPGVLDDPVVHSGLRVVPDNCHRVIQLILGWAAGKDSAAVLLTIG